MYYWDFNAISLDAWYVGFSSCQKNVLLGHSTFLCWPAITAVSVVVRRMYYWDLKNRHVFLDVSSFSSCQKNVLLGLKAFGGLSFVSGFSSCQKNVLLGLICHDLLLRQPGFSSCQKNVLLGLPLRFIQTPRGKRFQQLLEECTIGTCQLVDVFVAIPFQQLLEECTIGTPNATG